MRQLKLISGPVAAFAALGLVACGGSTGGTSDAAPASSSAAQQSTSGYDTIVSEDGAISFPADYKTWAHMGSWAVVNEGGEGNGMHNVFTTPDVIEAFKATGKFPDGAVLVKEVLASEGTELTTGSANWATDPQVWFVMVKDTQGRFEGNGLWGNGWGWALFNADAPTVQVASDFNNDCLGCHVPAQDTDWIYTYAYPALKAS